LTGSRAAPVSGILRRPALPKPPQRPPPKTKAARCERAASCLRGRQVRQARPWNVARLVGSTPTAPHQPPNSSPTWQGRSNKGLTTMSSYSRRLRPVNCKVCGQQVPRRRIGRARKYCSDKCRDAARRGRNFRGFGSTRYPSEAIPRNVENSSFTSNHCKGENRGRAPLNILGGSPWPDAVRIEPDLWRRIVLAEIGGA
jgi:hypothetical protein